MCVTFVDDAWETDVSGKGVTITYRSGKQVYVRQMSRADYRRGLELGLRKLNAFEAAEQEARRVVRMDAAKHG